MKIHRAYKTRCYPTIKQQKILVHHFGCARFVYNHFLRLKTTQYRQSKKSMSFNQTSKELTRMKGLEEFEWLKNVSRQSLLNSLVDLDASYHNFFNKKAKYPKFKKRDRKQSFRISVPFCKMKENGIHIPLIGVLKCSLDGLPEEYKLLSITVSKEPTGKYFVAVSFEQEIPNPKIDKKKPMIGIDFGLKTFITTSDGQKIEHPQPFKQDERRLKRLSRRHSRRQKESNRRKWAKRRVALQYERMKNRRNDFLHKLSRKMISENQAIYLEDLSLKGMMSRWGKKVGDLGWREFTRQLEYKGQWYGCQVNKIDRFFPSSKICSGCGHLLDYLMLSDREWDCPSCREHHDRDINAAKNILFYGRADRKLRTGRAGAVKPLMEPSSQNTASHGGPDLDGDRVRW
ncbi:MAG: RNA-guided endonuclease TnpB family protein [Candidatus Nanopelagicaceae bacterium]|nr:RNA-guided endonuclease TnpB family protein [Candidatus Nanopelagicaceae bacterium]